MISYKKHRSYSCCADEEYKDYYEVKTGSFSYWYPNGQLLAEGEFINTQLFVSTCYSGRKSVQVAQLPDSVKFHDAEGKVILDSEKLAELRQMILEL